MSESASVPPPIFAKSRWRLRRVLLVIATTLLAGWLGLSFLVTYLLTHRMGEPIVELPNSLGLVVDSVRLKTSDGIEIGAWVAAPKQNQPVVILVHGVHANRSAHRNQFRAFTRLGCGAVAITLRAHGDSGGDKIDFGLAEAQDVQAAVAFAASEFPTHKIVVYGESLGAAAALFASGDDHHPVAGYILDTPYIDLKSALFNRLSMYLPPVFSHTAYAGMRLWAPLFLERPINKYAPVDYIDEIDSEVPVLLIAGDRDSHAPADQSMEFARRCQHARMEVVQGAAHGQTYSRNPQKYEQLLADFIREIAAGR